MDLNPRKESELSDPLAQGDADDPDEVDVEENLREAREGEDEEPPL